MTVQSPHRSSLELTPRRQPGLSPIHRGYSRISIDENETSLETLEGFGIWLVDTSEDELTLSSSRLVIISEAFDFCCFILKSL